ncbi:DUF1799 domain-containing protein [Vreelandella venusta]|uniref:DUF1799 domain-containing protein n=1 Tax=Vreelandella venusta TaxID=44935 RepID=UPI0018DAA6BE|nr:DUF1799 domain-containing protein [Halomonas venusta]QPI66199.1 DUF1799 domain-containing protein [Halomonas venusta]
MVCRTGRAKPGRRKKLSGAGQWWASGPAPKDQRKKDADRWGLKDADVDDASQHFEVWQEHWPALELFLAMRTQWRVAVGMSGGQRLGIDYTSLYGHPKYARLDYDEQDKLLTQIQHIEAGALAAFNEQSYMAEQEAEERQQATQYIEQCVEQQYQLVHQQRINVQELINVVDLPHSYGDGSLVA